jgi:hypothetical protein
MKQYFLYYTEANIMCLVIFGVMLVHDLLNASRQEKQIKFDNALLAFMVYFAADCVWTAVEAGVLPRTLSSVVATNFANCIFMSLITYSGLPTSWRWRLRPTGSGC